MNTDMYHQIKETCLSHRATFIVVSKKRSIEEIMELYRLGHRHFGENKVQELVEKHKALPKDIHWHMIGHLQRNKVKQIIPFVYLIHSVDSQRLLAEINKQAQKCNRTVPYLFQMHIAEETTKFGFSQEAVFSLVQSDVFQTFKHAKPVGVMGMATHTNREEQVRQEFSYLHDIKSALEKTCFVEKSTFKEISMGMSNDYRLALEEGSTMVRIGSLVFV